MQIQYIGLKNFNSEETQVVNKLSEEHMQKINIIFPDSLLIIDLHKQDITGKVKYSIKAKLDNPNTILKAKAFDWDLNRTLHKLFKKIEHGIEHKYKIKQQPQQRAHPRKR